MPWERLLAHLARLLSVIGLFLVVSWAGLWLALPFVARAIGLGLFVLAALGALFPMVRFRWPSREAAAEPARPWHRHPPSPATALTDTLATQDPVALALVAGAARAHFGLDQAHPRRPAVAAAGDPRSLGAAHPGRDHDGRGLYRRRRRAGDAGGGGVRLERRACRRPISGSMPG